MVFHRLTSPQKRASALLNRKLLSSLLNKVFHLTFPNVGSSWAYIDARAAAQLELIRSWTRYFAPLTLSLLPLQLRFSPNTLILITVGPTAGYLETRLENPPVG